MKGGEGREAERRKQKRERERLEKETARKRETRERGKEDKVMSRQTERWTDKITHTHTQTLNRYV